MDLRAAVAILPRGRGLVDVQLRPALLPANVIEELEQRIRSLGRPPVREGPVAFLLLWLVWGGSDDLRDSFRHLYAPYFYYDCPTDFASAPAGEEPASQIAAQNQQSFWQGARRIFARLPAALRRAWSVVFRAPPATEQGFPPNFEWSLEEITAQIGKRPQCAELYGLRAELLRSRGHFDRAIKDYTEQLNRCPKNSEAHLGRGICYRAIGDKEQALNDLNEAVWQRPRSTKAHAARAWLYADLGSWARAYDDADVLIELEPDEPNWLVMRAKLRAASGKFDEAIEDLNRSLFLAPHCAETLFIRAQVYCDRPSASDQAKADFEAALADFTAVLRLHPEHALSYACRASVRLQLNDLTGARTDCTCDPAGPGVRLGLQGPRHAPGAARRIGSSHRRFFGCHSAESYRRDQRCLPCFCVREPEPLDGGRGGL